MDRRLRPSSPDRSARGGDAPRGAAAAPHGVSRPHGAAQGHGHQVEKRRGQRGDGGLPPRVLPGRAGERARRAPARLSRTAPRRAPPAAPRRSSSSTARSPGGSASAGHGVFGAATQANATIGRALRLVMRNVGGASPTAWRSPPRRGPRSIACCFAENEARSPWEPLHVERGHARPGRSAVTVVAVRGIFPRDRGAARLTGEGVRRDPGRVDALRREPGSTTTGAHQPPAP